MREALSNVDGVIYAATEYFYSCDLIHNGAVHFYRMWCMRASCVEIYYYFNEILQACEDLRVQHARNEFSCRGICCTGGVYKTFDASLQMTCT